MLFSFSFCSILFRSSLIKRNASDHHSKQFAFTVRDEAKIKTKSEHISLSLFLSLSHTFCLWYEWMKWKISVFFLLCALFLPRNMKVTSANERRKKNLKKYGKWSSLKNQHPNCLVASEKKKTKKKHVPTHPVNAFVCFVQRFFFQHYFLLSFIHVFQVGVSRKMMPKHWSTLHSLHNHHYRPLKQRELNGTNKNKTKKKTKIISISPISATVLWISIARRAICFIHSFIFFFVYF